MDTYEVINTALEVADLMWVASTAVNVVAIAKKSPKLAVAGTAIYLASVVPLGVAVGACVVEHVKERKLYK